MESPSRCSSSERYEVPTFCWSSRICDSSLSQASPLTAGSINQERKWGRMQRETQEDPFSSSLVSDVTFSVLQLERDSKAGKPLTLKADGDFDSEQTSDKVWCRDDNGLGPGDLDSNQIPSLIISPSLLSGLAFLICIMSDFKYTKPLPGCHHFLALWYLFFFFFRF